MTQNPPQPPTDPNKRQLKLEIPAALNATYANAVLIGQTSSEIVFDFLQVLPNDPRARVQSRVIMTPGNARLLLSALQNQIARYEAKHGPIPTPPASLADQLFGGVNSGDEPNG